MADGSWVPELGTGTIGGGVGAGAGGGVAGGVAGCVGVVVGAATAETFTYPVSEAFAVEATIAAMPGRTPVTTPLADTLARRESDDIHVVGWFGRARPVAVLTEADSCSGTPTLILLLFGDTSTRWGRLSVTSSAVFPALAPWVA